MSDLISRSEVNDVIDKLEVYTSGRPNTMKVEISVLQLQRLINKLKNIPTAYDIYKVIEELELHSFELGTDTLPAHYVRLNDAIEIVKQGGVSDDVCEWKQTSTARYKTSCGYKLEAHFGTNACYCRQCGKKIKIVGD